MKDFDADRAERENRERKFQIAGQEFKFRAAIEPNEWSRWVDLISAPLLEEVDEVAKVLAPVLNGNQAAADSWAKIVDVYSKVLRRGPDWSDADQVAEIDETIKAYLIPEHRDRWDAVRKAPLENPINLTDMLAVIEHMVEVTNGRPTTPASNSGNGGGSQTTGTPSTEESPSPEATSTA